MAGSCSIPPGLGYCLSGVQFDLGLVWQGVASLACCQGCSIERENISSRLDVLPFFLVDPLLQTGAVQDTSYRVSNNLSF